jgi:hypothetical protein
MQNQVLAHALSVREVFEVYNPAIGQTQKIHGNPDYQVSNKRTKEKEFASRYSRGDRKEPCCGRRWRVTARLAPIRRCSRSI